MENDFFKVFWLSNKDKLPENKLEELSYRISKLDSNEKKMLLSVEMKNPMTVFIISLFVGYLGIDRMYMGQVGLGILKLILNLMLIGGLWSFIDLFLVYSKTKELNYENLNKMISVFSN